MDSYEQDASGGDGLPQRAWRTAAACGPNGGNCVEVHLGVPGLVGLRDGKAAGGPVCVLDRGGWVAFVRSAKSGRFDRP